MSEKIDRTLRGWVVATTFAEFVMWAKGDGITEYRDSAATTYTWDEVEADRWQLRPLIRSPDRWTLGDWARLTVATGKTLDEVARVAFDIVQSEEPCNTEAEREWALVVKRNRERGKHIPGHEEEGI